MKPFNPFNTTTEQAEKFAITKHLISQYTRGYVKDIYSAIDADKSNFSWYILCRDLYVDQEFIDKYKKYINWIAVSQHQDLSVELIHRYSGKLIFKFLIKNNCFMEKVREGLIDWNIISENIKITKEDLQSDNAILYLNFDIIKKRYPNYFI